MPISDEQRAFASELQVIKAKAMSLGLYRTYHVLNDATYTVGWEMAVLDDPDQQGLWDKAVAARKKAEGE